MGYSRRIQGVTYEGDALTHAMVGVGFGFAVGRPDFDPNLEDVLISAAREGVLKPDYRVLSILTTWFGVHGAWVNADRLVRLALCEEDPQVRRYWSALAHWQRTDPRFKRLRSLFEDRVSLLSVDAFLLARNGEDPRLVEGPLVVPAGTLRDRLADVAPPTWLVKHHRVYRERVVQGPSYRADMWALAELHPEWSASQLARAAYGSHATARRVLHERALLAAA